MLSRRRFVSLSAAAAGAAMVGPLKLEAAATTASGLDFGVQLFTVRNDISDVGATFELIHQIGYASIETYPIVYNRSAKDLKALISAHGLKAPSGHFDYETLDSKVDYAAELGVEYMVCPMIPESMWNSLDGFHQAAEHLNKAAAKATAAGLKFGYHPHNYEFKKIDGSRGFDVLMKELDPSVRLELDIYWATEAGEDPIELMRKNRKRLALIHIKDHKPGFPHSFAPDEHAEHFTEAGTGIIDWKTVLGEARKLGVKQFFVDQDGSDHPVEQCLRMNWKYLSQLKF
jgi:sugar phosphate isomerase/epimerase